MVWARLFLKIRVNGILGGQDFLKWPIVKRHVTPEPRRLILRFGPVTLEVEANAMEIKIFELRSLQVLVDHLGQGSACGHSFKFALPRRTAHQIERNLDQLKSFFLLAILHLLEGG